MCCWGDKLIDPDIQVLKIFSDIAETTFRTRKSSISRIEASDFTDEAKDNLKKQIVGPLDETLAFMSGKIQSTLALIPIYNMFLKRQEGLNIYDCAQLISLLKDIDNFDTFSNLMSYAGFIPRAKNYNKKLHKLLQRLGYKLISKSPQYRFIYEINIQRYSEQHPNYSKTHIENMAKRIVIKRFLKNLYFSWNQINKEDF